MPNTSRPQMSRPKIRRAIIVCEHPLLGERMVSQFHLKRPIYHLNRLAYNECPQKGSLIKTAERAVRRLYGDESAQLQLSRLGMFSNRNSHLQHDIESTVFFVLPTEERYRRIFNKLDTCLYEKLSGAVQHEITLWREQAETLRRAS